MTPARKSPWFWAAVLLWLAASAAYGWTNLRRYALYDPTLFDVAHFAHMSWNTLHGRPFESMIWEGPRVLIAFSTIMPIYFLLVGAFMLHPAMETAILLGPTALFSAAVPLFLLARERLRSEPLAFAAALAYALQPFASLGAMVGINEMQFLPAPLLWAAWALAAGRTRPYWIALILANATKTFSVAMTFLWGAVVWRTDPERRALGRRTAILSGAWIVLSVGALAALSRVYGATVEAETAHLSDLGSTPGEVARHLATRPWLLATRLLRPGTALGLAGALLPWMGLPLAAPAYLLPLAPQAYYAFFTGFPETGLVFGALAFVPLAAVEGLRRLGTTPGRRRALGLGLVAAAAAAHWLTPPMLGPAPLSRGFSLSRYERTDRHRLADEIVAAIPLDATVIAEYGVSQHLWKHSGANHFTYHARPADYDWAVLDLERMALHDAPEAKFFQGARRGELVAMLESGAYGVVRFEDAFLVMRRGADPSGNGPALAALRRWRKVD